MLTQKEIAESFQGAMHSDTIISLNQTADEYGQERMRLHLAKNRNAVSSKTITIYTQFRKGSFYKWA